MDRDQAYMRMLGATANMQWNVAMILEAKAEEAEKARNWICNHITSDPFSVSRPSLSNPCSCMIKLSRSLTGLIK